MSPTFERSVLERLGWTPHWATRSCPRRFRRASDASGLSRVANVPNVELVVHGGHIIYVGGGPSNLCAVEGTAPFHGLQLRVSGSLGGKGMSSGLE